MQSSRERSSGQRPAQGPYDAVVFAGGGCRCFWQAGFWAEAGPALSPRVVGSVSAGSAFACAAFSETVHAVVEDFTRRAARNPRNVYPANVLRREPVFPHEDMYRGAILTHLDDEGFARLQAGPEIFISIGVPPAWTGVRTGYLLGLIAFLIEQVPHSRVHALWGRRFGFRSESISVRACRTAEDVANLILWSSSTPPVLPLYRRNGRAVLDGGIYDHVPVEAVPPARNTLVLLTKQYPPSSLPKVKGRTYLQPSEPIPVAKWDYTSPELVQRTFDLGRADGERFVREHQRSNAA